jgi:AdoMet-dependent heme synthase
MDTDHYLGLHAEVSLKEQPTYNLLFFPYKGKRLVLGLNDVALAITTRCDGSRTFDDIVGELSVVFSDTPQAVSDKVQRFLGKLGSLDLMTYSGESFRAPVKVMGTKDFVTPEHIVLELTHRCPLKCLHCYLDAGDGPSMDYRLLLPVLDDLTEEIGIRGVQLTGGEPFAHPDITEVIDYLTSKHIDIQVTTSGIIFNERVRRAIDSLSLVRSVIQVSVDGLEETHNAIRGSRHSFHNAMNVVTYAVGRGVQTDTATSLIDQSREEIFALCAKMKDVGVRRFRLGAVSNQGRAEHAVECLFSADDAIGLIAELREEYQDDHFRVGPIEELDLRPEDYNCGAGTKLLCLDPTLKVRPCPLMGVQLGDLTSESILDVVKRGSASLSRVAAPSGEACGDCSQLSHCRGCIAEGIVNSKRLPGCGWLEREKVHLASFRK